jgi:hypothetical protein
MTGPEPMEAPEPQGLHLVAAGDVPEPLTTTSRRRTAWTAAELMALTFPDPKWAVPGILAEGVNLLCGPPKVGKSWLSLSLGLAVASGGTAFGSVPVVGGPVLYLALEDTPRRLQSRMGKILGGQPAPPGLTLATDCPPLPQGGAEAIANWIGRNPDARMVVIDVFTKVRGSALPGMSAYEADYAAITHVKRLADRHEIAVVLVHHVRKMASEDFLTEVSGTNGLAGAADATLVLKRARGQADGVLHVTGRDVDEAEYALSFDAPSGSWKLLDGSVIENTVGDTRAAILRHVHAHPGAKPKDIAAALPDADAGTVRRTCARMVKAGQLSADGNGRYALPGGTPTGDAQEVSHLSQCPSDPPTWEFGWDRGGTPPDELSHPSSDPEVGT